MSRTACFRRGRIALVAGLALLVGCATAGSEPPPVCPPVPAYDAATLDAAADAVEALPPDSPLIPLLSDCAVLRAQSRACHGDGS